MLLRFPAAINQTLTRGSNRMIAAHRLAVTFEMRPAKGSPHRIQRNVLPACSRTLAENFSQIRRCQSSQVSTGRNPIRSLTAFIAVFCSAFQVCTTRRSE